MEPQLKTATFCNMNPLCIFYKSKVIAMLHVYQMPKYYWLATQQLGLSTESQLMLFSTTNTFPDFLPIFLGRYGDSAGNTAVENSSVLSLIRMH